MRRTKRCMSVILCMAMLVCTLNFVLPASAADEADAAASDFEYTVNSDGVSCTITGFKADKIPDGTTTVDITIPDTIDGYTVVTIGKQAFKGVNVNGGLLTLPDSVKTIEANAFENAYCSVEKWPESLESIGNSAFVHGKAMTGEFPAGLKSIDKYAFQYAEIESPIFPEGLESLGQCAFEWCNYIEEFIMPDSVTTLEDHVVRTCFASLKKVRFPRNSTLTTVPANTFSAAYNGGDENYIFNSMSIYIPENYTTVPESLLKNFKTGAVVTIYGVADSGAHEFYKTVSASLEAGTYLNNAGGKMAAINFVEYDFDNEPQNDTIYDYSVISEADKTAKITGFNKKNITETDDLSSISIPSEIMGYTITEIGDSAFADNTVIQSVVIPDTVTTIGYKAFGGTMTDGVTNGNIVSVKLPASLKTIGANAFQCNEGLSSIELPEGLETIGVGAFYCTGLTQITIPNSVTSIGESAFRLCWRLEYIQLPAGISTYKNEFYSSNMNVKDIIIPASVTSIGASTFASYEMDTTVYGVAGTYAEQWAAEHNFKFVSVIANTVVAAGGIYGDGSKELAGTDYDISYGFETFGFKGKLVNIGTTDTQATVIIALYDETGMMLERNSSEVTIPAETTVEITEENIVSIPANKVKDGCTVKTFVWRSGNNEPISKPVEITFDEEKREIHVLAIANSFGNDSFGFINKIAEADGIVIKAQNMYIGGAKLSQHYDNMVNNKAEYQPVIDTVYGSELITMQAGLESDKWDVVALQAATHGKNSDDYDFIDYGTDSSNADTIYEYIKSYVSTYAPEAAKVMHMSWGPCEEESKLIYGGRFANEENARSAVAQAQQAAYSYASTIYADGANMMVPTSIAVSYALDTLGYQEHSGTKNEADEYTSPVSGEISIYRDEVCHLTVPYGRVLVGLTWYEYLTGNDARENPYQNSAVPADVMTKLKEAAHYANTQVAPLVNE